MHHSPRKTYLTWFKSANLCLFFPKYWFSTENNLFFSMLLRPLWPLTYNQTRATRTHRVRKMQTAVRKNTQRKQTMTRSLFEWSHYECLWRWEKQRALTHLLIKLLIELNSVSTYSLSGIDTHVVFVTRCNASTVNSSTLCIFQSFATHVALRREVASFQFATRMDQMWRSDVFVYHQQDQSHTMCLEYTNEFSRSSNR